VIPSGPSFHSAFGSRYPLYDNLFSKVLPYSLERGVPEFVVSREARIFDIGQQLRSKPRGLRFYIFSVADRDLRRFARAAIWCFWSRAEKGVSFWNNDMADRFQRLVMFLKTAAALIIGALRRIRSDDQKPSVSIQTLMADTGRDHDDIAGRNLDGLPLFPPRRRVAYPRATPSTS